VQGLEEDFLVEEYAGGCGRVWCQLFYLLASESKAQEASRYSTLLSILGWKWEQISIDFIVGLLRTKEGNDSIWVIVDRIMNSAHFLLVKTTSTVDILGKIYIWEIVRLHGIPVPIMSDRGSSFTSRLWKILQKALGTQLNSAMLITHRRMLRRSGWSLEDMWRNIYHL